MLKKISKIIAGLFMITTILSQGIGVWAADISIRPTTGNLTIHKYWADTSENIGTEGNGTEQTIPADNPAILGIQFDVWLMTAVSDAPETPPSEKDGWMYVRSNDSLTVKKEAVTYTYTLTAQTADDATGKTDTNGSLTYTGLTAGYYYVEENLAASSGYKVQGDGNEGKEITSAANPFIVAVPMTTPDGTGWNQDVHVYPKNQGLNPEKKPDVPSVEVGSSVKWQISANIPSDFKTYKRFEVIDDLDKRLNYDKTKGVEAYGTDAAETEPPKVILEVSSDNGVTGDFVTTHGLVDGKEKLTITLTAAGIGKLAETEDVVKLVIKFNTKVNGNISNEINDGENIIENKAIIKFENSSTTDGEIATPPSNIDTGEIGIDKKDSDGKTALPGAEFSLAPSADSAADEEFLKVKLDDSNKYIVAILSSTDAGYDDADTYHWKVVPHETDAAKLGLQEDSGTYYATSFEGLQTHDEALNWKSYWIIETKAPKGYNLLGAPVEVTFDDGLTHYVKTELVTNKKGFLLPKTGGAGMIILVVAGIVLIGSGIIISMNKKKKTA